MSGDAKLTKAQRKVLQHVADNPGKLRDASSPRDFPKHVCRGDVLTRVWFAGLIAPPRVTNSYTWELTEAGLAALTKAQALKSEEI